MNAITETAPVSAATLEHVLGTGELSELSTAQRVEYYARVCQTLGLNPFTRPFRFLTLNGKIQLYATRDATDQLRKLNGITLRIVDQRIDGDLFIVTVAAKDKAGREDQDIGAVTLGKLMGESKANALMKALTKAKRRVTLSICGLGLTDESELDTMPGAAVFDADQTPPAPMPVISQPEPAPPAATNGTRTLKQAGADLVVAFAQAQSIGGLANIEASDEAQRIINEYSNTATGKDVIKARDDARTRLAVLFESDGWPRQTSEITPADRLMSG